MLSGIDYSGISQAIHPAILAMLKAKQNGGIYSPGMTDLLNSLPSAGLPSLQQAPTSTAPAPQITMPSANPGVGMGTNFGAGGYQPIGGLDPSVIANIRKYASDSVGVSDDEKASLMDPYNSEKETQYLKYLQDNRPQPVNGGAYPIRQFPDVPNRPAPGSDTLSSVLAGIAGLISPSAAGELNAAPLHAAISVANQQYEDRLRQHQMHMEQAAQGQGDQEGAYRANVGQQEFNSNQNQKYIDQTAAPFATVEAGKLHPTGDILKGIADRSNSAAKAKANLGAEDFIAKLQEQQTGPMARYYTTMGKQAEDLRHHQETEANAANRAQTYQQIADTQKELVEDGKIPIEQAIATLEKAKSDLYPELSNSLMDFRKTMGNAATQNAGTKALIAPSTIGLNNARTQTLGATLQSKIERTEAQTGLLRVQAANPNLSRTPQGIALQNEAKSIMQQIAQENANGRAAIALNNQTAQTTSINNLADLNKRLSKTLEKIQGMVPNAPLQSPAPQQKVAPGGVATAPVTKVKPGGAVGHYNSKTGRVDYY